MSPEQPSPRQPQERQWDIEALAEKHAHPQNGTALDPEQQRLHRLHENEILAQFHKLLERLEAQNDAFTFNEIAADLKAAGLE